MKQEYTDSEKIMWCLAEAEQLRITRTDDLIYFLQARTGYDLNEDNISYYKTKFKKEFKPNYNTWLEGFARNNVLQTAKTHLETLELIRNDMVEIYNKKVKVYKQKLQDGEEPDPLELSEILDVKGHIEGTLDHIEKRNLAVQFLLPFKLTIDKVTNKPKLDKADPDTRTAILVADLEAEHIEKEQKALRDYTDIHGEENLVA